jgi:hypothetical protein
MLKRLGIDDNGLHDLGFDKEMDVPKEGINYIALSRVHTTNCYSLQTFEQSMRVAMVCSTAKEVLLNA